MLEYENLMLLAEDFYRLYITYLVHHSEVTIACFLNIFILTPIRVFKQRCAHCRYVRIGKYYALRRCGEKYTKKKDKYGNLKTILLHPKNSRYDCACGRSDFLEPGYWYDYSDSAVRR